MSIDKIYGRWADGRSLDSFTARRLALRAVKNRDAELLTKLLGRATSEAVCDELVLGLLEEADPWSIGQLAHRGGDYRDAISEALEAFDDEDFVTAYRSNPRGVTSGKDRQDKAWARGITTVRFSMLAADSWHSPKSWMVWLAKEHKAGRVPTSDMRRILSKNGDAGRALVKKVPGDVELLELVLEQSSETDARYLREPVLEALKGSLDNPAWVQGNLRAPAVRVLKLLEGAQSRTDAIAGSPLAEVIAKAHADLVAAGLPSTLVHAPEGEEPEPLSAEAVSEALKEGKLPQAALEAVEAGLSEASWWREVVSHPDLSTLGAARLALEVKGSLRGFAQENPHAELMEVMLKERSQEWLLELAERMWPSHKYEPSSYSSGNYLSSKDPLEMVFRRIDHEAQARMVKNWCPDQHSLTRALKVLSWHVPTSVVNDSPVAWGAADAEIAERFLRECRSVLGTNDAYWEAFEDLESGFEGTFGELLALATTLHRE
jgi:hypothetical protein